MKHPVAVAIMNGFNASLAQEIENGNITLKTAEQAGRFAMAIAREYLKGTQVFGKKLQDFASDGEKLERILNAEKINLQRYGDV